MLCGTMIGKFVHANVNTVLLISRVKVNRHSGTGDYAWFVSSPCSISTETDTTAESHKYYDTYGCDET